MSPKYSLKSCSKPAVASCFARASGTGIMMKSIETPAFSRSSTILSNIGSGWEGDEIRSRRVDCFGSEEQEPGPPIRHLAPPGEASSKSPRLLSSRRKNPTFHHDYRNKAVENGGVQEVSDPAAKSVEGDVIIE